jgi:mannose-6-phosphate isomerase-like protein (cupin superfamily)
MQPCIRKADSFSEFHIDEGCYITEVSNSGADPDLSVAIARVETGVTTEWHMLRGTAERYLIISGRGLVEIGDLAPVEVVSGDVVLIPPMCRQRITNTGNEDLVFFAVCMPRFSNEAYIHSPELFL